MAEARDIIEKVLKASPYNTEVDIETKKSLKISYDRFLVPSQEEATNLQIRVTKGKRYGYSSTTDLVKWKKCLRSASKIMRVSKPLEIKPELPGKQRYLKYPPDKKLWSLDYPDLFGLFDRMFKVKPKVIGANISKANSKSLIANSNGLRNDFKSTALSAIIEVKRKGVSAFGVRLDRKTFDTEEVSSEAEEFCLKSLGPKKIETMTTDVVMDYFALSALIGTVLIPSFYADKVQRQESFLSDKAGQTMFSKKLTITDDGTRGLLSGPCDQEGVSTKRKKLVNKGVVFSFLYDSYSAQKDKMKSTGNCSSLAKRPSIGPTNITVKPGKRNPSTSDCLYVRSLTGVHTSNPVSGDFSVSVDSGFYKGKPVKHAMISGNIFRLFSKIESIGRTPRQEDAINTPPIRFSDVQIVA